MDTSKRTSVGEEYNNEPIVSGKKTVWFLNGDLVKIHHYTRSTGLITVY